MNEALLFFAALFLLGGIVGSFSCLVAHRLHTGRPLVAGGSRCDSCGVRLRALQLIPFFSFLFLKGRCAACGSAIHPKHALAELLYGAAFVLSWYVLGFSFAFFFTIAFFSLAGTIVLYDIAHTIIPNVLVYPLMALGGVWALLSTGETAALLHTILSAIGVSGFILALWFFSKGRAMGFGDVKLVFALALFVGFPASVAGLLFSFWGGAVISILLLLYPRKHRTIQSEVPFAPYLALGFLCAHLLSTEELLALITLGV